MWSNLKMQGDWESIKTLAEPSYNPDSLALTLESLGSDRSVTRLIRHDSRVNLIGKIHGDKVALAAAVIVTLFSNPSEALDFLSEHHSLQHDGLDHDQSLIDQTMKRFWTRFQNPAEVAKTEQSFL